MKSEFEEIFSKYLIHLCKEESISVSKRDLEVLLGLASKTEHLTTENEDLKMKLNSQEEQFLNITEQLQLLIDYLLDENKKELPGN